MPRLPNHAINTLMENSKKLESERYRSKDKHDRATAEQGKTVVNKCSQRTALN